MDCTIGSVNGDWFDHVGSYRSFIKMFLPLVCTLTKGPRALLNLSSNRIYILPI